MSTRAKGWRLPSAESWQHRAFRLGQRPLCRDISKKGAPRGEPVVRVMTSLLVCCCHHDGKQAGGFQHAKLENGRDTHLLTRQIGRGRRISQPGKVRQRRLTYVRAKAVQCRHEIDLEAEYMRLPLVTVIDRPFHE